MRKLILLFALFIIGSILYSQELNVTIRVNTQKLQQTDPKVFETLEGTIIEFMNGQKWTDDIVEVGERINANMIITLQEEISVTSFKADIAIQASRPIYGSDYETPLINYLDKGVTFTYEQFQPLQFSTNRFNDNLSSVLAFYAYVILGLDYDSFSPYGGEKFFQEALAIVNNVPENAAAANPGWRSLDGNRNRYWIIENLLSPRVRAFRQGWYEYHRQGLDLASTDVATCRAIINSALDQFRAVDDKYPNSAIIQIFTDTKATEVVEIFKRGTPKEQTNVYNVMTKLDASNVTLYRQIK